MLEEHPSAKESEGKAESYQKGLSITFNLDKIHTHVCRIFWCGGRRGGEVCGTLPQRLTTQIFKFSGGGGGIEAGGGQFQGPPSV